jgi:hypothetical protein
LRVIVALYFVVCLLLTPGCKQTPAREVPMPDNPYIAPVFLTFSEGHFRGILLGSSRKEVQQLEADRLELKDEQENHLFYELIFPRDSAGPKSLEYADIKYFFKGGKLDIVTIEYYLNEEAQLDTIAAMLSTLYNEVHSRGYKDPGGYTVWDITSEPAKGELVKYDIGIKKVKAPYSDTYLSVEFLKY